MSNSSGSSGQVLRSGQDTLLGNYELLGEIGGGELYSVQRARSIVSFGSRGDVALKRLRSGSHDEGARARLLREARVGLGLRAPNLVRVLEVHDEPELFLVMEYVEGVSLHQLLAQAVDERAVHYVLPMFVDVLSGLSALHHWKNEEGAPGFLVHQAPTLRHMLVGVDGITRLVDLADVYGPLLGATAHVGPRTTRHGALAPEQFDASHSLDPRCDIFLVGMALQDALMRLGAGQSIATSHAAAHWGVLHAVAERARSPQRSARFWSADEMAFTLRNAAVEAGLFASREAISAWVRSTCALDARTASAESASSILFCSRADPPASTPLLPLPVSEVVPVWSTSMSSEMPSVSPHVLGSDATELWPDAETTLWLHEEDGHLKRRPSSTRVHDFARAAASEPTLVIRDFDSRSPLRRFVGPFVAAAALAGVLSLGLRGAPAADATSAPTSPREQPDTARGAPSTGEVLAQEALLSAPANAVELARARPKRSPRDSRDPQPATRHIRRAEPDATPEAARALAVQARAEPEESRASSPLEARATITPGEAPAALPDNPY